jgi:hypothetical protein
MKIVSRIGQIGRKAVAGILLTLAQAGFTQTVISVPSSGTAVTHPRPGFGGPKPASYSDINSAFTSLAPLARWASVNVRPHLLYSIIYGDGILRVPGEPATSTVQSLTAGILFDLGKHWGLSYSGSRTWNSSRLLADYTSHDASLSGGLAKGNWTFGATQTYASKTPTLVETAGQVPEISYSTGGSVSYQLGSRSLVNLQMTRNVRDSEFAEETQIIAAQDLEQWSGSGTLHYRFSSRLDVAMGMKFGYDSLSNSADMNTSEPQITINWRPTDKLTFTGTGGVETREFRRGIAEDLDSEVYSVSGSYQPTITTAFSINANRLVSPSYFAGQLSKSSGWGVDVKQRVLQRFYVVVGFQHGETSYLVLAQGFSVGRDDDFDSFHSRISVPFLSRGSVGLTYQRTRNSSTVPGYGFTSNQYGAEIGYRF